MRRLIALLLVTFMVLMTGCEEPEGIQITNQMGGDSDWRDEIIYQVLVDRFADGDPNNNFNVNKLNPGGYHGGDWEGLINKLDYIEDLGVTALWVSPAVLNVEQDADFSSYHGYWAQHLTKVNPHFGDLNKFRELVRECHKRNIKVILDIVANHMGQLFYYDVDNNYTARNFAIGSGVDPYQNWYGNDNCNSNYICKEGFTCNPDDGYCYNRHMEVSEYDPAYNPFGVQGFSALGQNGLAPTYFFDMPEINRLPGEPTNMDLDGDGIVGSVTNPSYVGKITEQDELLGFSNMSWYHQKGRVTSWKTGDWDAGRTVYENGTPHSCSWQYEDVRQNGINASTKGCTNWKDVVRVSDASDWNQVVKGDFPGGLKDLATEKPAVRRALIEVFKYWIRETNIDGFRIDTVKHVEHSFWQEFGPAMRTYAKNLGKDKFFMYGEVFGSGGAATGVYTKGNALDSVFYFPQKYAIEDVVKLAEGTTSDIDNDHDDNNNPQIARSSTKNLENLLVRRYINYCSPHNQAEAKCDKTFAEHGVYPSSLLVNFLDNHDIPRFLNHNANVENPQPVPTNQLHSALMYLLTIDGIPCIYYGTEQNFHGSNDPNNREDLWPSGYDKTNSTFKLIATLNKIRQEYPALRRGSYQIVWTSKESSNGGADDAGIFAFKRITPEGDGAIVVINFNPNGSKTADNIDPAGITGTLTNVFPDKDGFHSPGAGRDAGRISVTVPPRSIKIFVTNANQSLVTPYNASNPYDSSKI